MAETATRKPMTVPAVTIELLRLMAIMATRRADDIERFGAAAYYEALRRQQETSADG